MKRSASAVWHGPIKEGKGSLETQSHVLKDTPYSFRSRFADGTETNPEELIGAAHAGCFSMALSKVLGEAGFTADSLTTKATVSLDPVDGGFSITAIHLELRAKVPHIDEATFKQSAEKAKANCPVSKALNAKITLDAALHS
jgi:lipoyl-dependent peroxiredoxin